MTIDASWSSLVGVVLGGLLAGGATYYIAWRTERTNSRNLALAVAGEAAAIAAIVRFRDYQGEIRSHIATAALGDIVRLSLQLPESTVPVARAAQQEAGALPGMLPILVPRLVLLTDGFAADVKRLDTYELNDPKSLLEEGNPEQAANFYVELDTLLTMILSSCDQIVSEARRLYPKVEAFKPANLDFSNALFEQEKSQEVARQLQMSRMAKPTES